MKLLIYFQFLQFLLPFILTIRNRHRTNLRQVADGPVAKEDNDDDDEDGPGLKKPKDNNVTLQAFWNTSLPNTTHLDYNMNIGINGIALNDNAIDSDEEPQGDEFSTNAKKEEAMNPEHSQSYYSEEFKTNTMTYRVVTPKFPKYVTVSDIQVFLQEKAFQIKAKGSGNFYNKIIKPLYGMDTLRPTALGRDWEIWINLKQPVLSTCVPAIKKTRKKDNYYEIELKMSRLCIDKDYEMDVFPLFFKNQTHRGVTHDLYHLTIPKDPHYIMRSMETPGKKLYETMTVQSRTGKHEEAYRRANTTFKLELNTLNTIKNFEPEDAKSSFVNVDQITPKGYKIPKNKDSYRHDNLFYDILHSIDRPVYHPDLTSIQHYTKHDKSLRPTDYDRVSQEVAIDQPQKYENDLPLGFGA